MRDRLCFVAVSCSLSFLRFEITFTYETRTCCSSTTKFMTYRKVSQIVFTDRAKVGGIALGRFPRVLGRAQTGLRISTFESVALQNQ